MRVADMRLYPRDDGIAVLAVQVAQPVEALAASIFAHDSIDAAWRAGLSFTATDNALVWVAGLGPAAELSSLLEVGNLNADGAHTWGPLRPDITRWVFLKPETSDSDWVSGERAQAELSRIEQMREQRFTAPLVAPGASPNAPEFLILAIADNLLITQPQRVPGISLHPVTTVLGEDVRIVLNRVLREHGIVTQWLSKKSWLAQMRSNRPAVLIECHVQAETPDAAATYSREVIKQMLDMMTLRRGAAANLIAGVVTNQNEFGRNQIRDAWIEHSGYGENLLGGFLAGEDVHALQSSWSGLQANPRAQLWVSLYADAVRDPRWEYQFFRCFSLLEAIADDTLVGSENVILDEAGKPRPLPKNKRKHFTTSGTQGKVYTLLMQLDGKTADDQRWEDVVMWAEVRHEVAHEGTWQFNDPAETPKHAATHAAITAYGRDGTFESGADAIVKNIREYVKRALYAAIHGTL